MNAPPPDMTAEATRWLREAAEELAVADAIVADITLPPRAACFHAHLAAEKALKALAISRGVELKRAHDLAYLHGLLPVSDVQGVAVDDLAALNPWTIEGRYPADLSDAADISVKDIAAAGRRVVAEVERLLTASAPNSPGD